MAEGGGGGVLRELLAVFSFGVDTKELKHGENAVEQFLEKIQKFATAIAGAFLAKEIYEWAEAQTHLLTQIERTGLQLGISTERVQEFQFAAKSLGLDAENLLNMMGRLQVQQQAAAVAGSKQAEVFKHLGVSIKDTGGHMKNADELFLDAAEGISQLKDPSDQAAAATKLFGRQGRVLLPFLKEGRKGAEEYFKTFKELGGSSSEGAIHAAKEFEKQSAKTDLSLTVIKQNIAKNLLPILTKLSAGVGKIFDWFGKLAKNSNILQAALVVLGSFATVFAIKMAIAFAPLLAAAAAVAFLVLTIDDLITFMQGGKSLIGDFINQIFGEGASLEAVKGIKDAWHDIGQAFEHMMPYVTKFWDFMTWLVSTGRKALADVVKVLFIPIDFERAQHGKNPLGPELAASISGDINKGRFGQTANENLANMERQKYSKAIAGRQNPGGATIPAGMTAADVYGPVSANQPFPYGTQTGGVEPKIEVSNTIHNNPAGESFAITEVKVDGKLKRSHREALATRKTAGSSQ